MQHLNGETSEFLSNVLEPDMMAATAAAGVMGGAIDTMVRPAGERPGARL